LLICLVAADLNPAMNGPRNFSFGPDVWLWVTSATAPASPKAPTFGALPPASMQVVPVAHLLTEFIDENENQVINIFTK
jgi:hypothetical protein